MVIEALEMCNGCSGTGRVLDLQICDQCGGSGRVLKSATAVTPVVCSVCDGTGLCQACNARGLVDSVTGTDDSITAPTAPTVGQLEAVQLEPLVRRPRRLSDKWRAAIGTALGVKLPAWVSHIELVKFLVEVDFLAVNERFVEHDKSSSDSSEAPTAPTLLKCSQAHSDFQRVRCFECIAERITALERRG